MPGIPNPPANISVIIGQPGNINVQVGSPQPRVTGVTYGGRTLLSATDLDIGVNPVDGEVIAFNTANNTFELESIGDITVPTSIDGGGF